MTSRQRSLSWAVLLVGVVLLLGLIHGPPERPRPRWRQSRNGAPSPTPLRPGFTVPIRFCGRWTSHAAHLWQSAGNPEKRRRGSNYWCEGVAPVRSGR